MCFIFQVHTQHEPDDLKGIDNEKRGRLSVVSFDRSPFTLFSLKFTNKLVEAPSCERHKTAPQTLFLLFANYNCFLITLWCRTATPFSHHANLSEPMVLNILPDIWEAGKDRLSIINLFQITLTIHVTFAVLAKNQQQCLNSPRGMQVSWIFNKPPTLYCYWETIFYLNDRNRVPWVVLGLLQAGACTDLVENLSVNSLKGDISNATTFNQPLFSLVNTFKQVHA